MVKNCVQFHYLDQNVRAFSRLEMSIQLQTRKQGSRMLDPWDDDDMETPRKFSLSVDSTDGASGKKLQRKKKGTVNPRLRNSTTARSSNQIQNVPNAREKKARPTKPPVPSFDGRENQPVRSNENATPVGVQWSQHNKARPAYAAVRVSETNTIRKSMPEMPERGVSAETRRTQEQLGSMMTFFQNSASSSNQVLQSAGREDALRTSTSAAQQEIHREITIKPWNSSPAQTDSTTRTSSDSQKSSPVVAIVSRTKPRHHPAAEVDDTASEATAADSSPTGVATAPKSGQLQRLRDDLDAERSRANAAEASVERLAAQLLQRDRIAHVSNSPEPKNRPNSPMAGPSDALEKLQAQILKNKNSDLELLVQDLMRENQELRAQQEKFMDSYGHEEQSVDRRRDEALAQIDQLRHQLSRQKQEFIAREAQLQSAQNELRKNHQEELRKQRAVLEKSNQESTDLRAAVQQLAAATAEDRARCRQLEDQAVTQDGAVEETRVLNQKLHDQQQKLRERCLALEVRLAEANKRAERATQEAESNYRKAENLSTHLMETKQAYTKIMSRVADLEQQNSQNDSQSAMIEGLQQQLMDTKQRLFAEEKRSTDLEIHCRELMARLKALAAREHEPGSMDRTSQSQNIRDNSKVAASNAAGECMALRRQVQVLTRQVTELEEANTQLALIKTTQVRRVISTVQTPCVWSLVCHIISGFLTVCAQHLLCTLCCRSWRPQIQAMIPRDGCQIQNRLLGSTS